MRIAISTDGDYVSEHFGRCAHFTVLDLEGNKVLKREKIENPGHQPNFIPNFLHQKGVECVICGGMGMRARNNFYEMGIKTILGVSGKIEEVIGKIEKGKLEGGESLCKPGKGKGYGVEKTVCDHKNGDS